MNDAVNSVIIMSTYVITCVLVIYGGCMNCVLCVEDGVYELELNN